MGIKINKEIASSAPPHTLRHTAKKQWLSVTAQRPRNDDHSLKIASQKNYFCVAETKWTF